MTIADLLAHCEREIYFAQKWNMPKRLIEHTILKRLLSGEPLEALFPDGENYDDRVKECETCKWNKVDTHCGHSKGNKVTDCWTPTV